MQHRTPDPFGGTHVAHRPDPGNCLGPIRDLYLEVSGSIPAFHFPPAPPAPNVGDINVDLGSSFGDLGSSFGDLNLGSTDFGSSFGSSNGDQNFGSSELGLGLDGSSILDLPGLPGISGN